MDPRDPHGGEHDPLLSFLYKNDQPSLPGLTLHATASKFLSQVPDWQGDRAVDTPLHAPGLTDLGLRPITSWHCVQHPILTKLCCEEQCQKMSSRSLPCPEGRFSCLCRKNGVRQALQIANVPMLESPLWRSPTQPALYEPCVPAPLHVASGTVSKGGIGKSLLLWGNP